MRLFCKKIRCSTSLSWQFLLVGRGHGRMLRIDKLPDGLGQAALLGGLNLRLAVGATDLAHRYRLTGFRFLLGHDFSLSTTY